jgi:hypothetical protein
MKSDTDSIQSDMGMAIRDAVTDLGNEYLYSGSHFFDQYHYFKRLKFSKQ